MTPLVRFRKRRTRHGCRGSTSYNYILIDDFRVVNVFCCSLIRAETLAQENRKLRDKNRDLLLELDDCKQRQEETYEEVKKLMEL